MAVLWTPDQLSSLALWLDASNSGSITESAGKASQWNDLSGNARHATQATGAQQPETGSASINGLNALDFTGTDVKLLVDNDFITSQVTCFVVYSGGAANGRLVDARGQGAFGAQKGWFLKNSQSPTADMAAADNGAGDYRAVNAAVDATTKILGFAFDGSSIFLRDNGTDVGSPASSASPPADIQNTGVDLNIGGNATYSGAQDFTGQIAEVVILDVGADSDTVDLIEGYLAHKWGLETSLPPGHPYVADAPEIEYFARIAMPSPLAAPLWTMEQIAADADARISMPSPLAAPSIRVFQDFASAVTDPTIRYVMRITGTPEVEIPVSSWQATLQTGSLQFLQCVIPATTPYLDLLSARRGTSDFVVYRVGFAGAQEVESEMARAPLSQINVNAGPRRETATLSGYAPAPTDAVPPGTKALTGIRSTSQTLGGNSRVRAEIDWFLRPGQTVTADGITFTANYINYFVPTEGDAYMDVGSRG